ncbi:tetratricopeptide repeat protein [Brucella intermedia]|uniref:tetratricopeptide repeat protein n=1 Tax=Brucella intermedia TaxID=94625 RepID=UPI000469330F|nr:tetratricopeptide repeat protein [Brucella intermedia]
MNSVLFAIVNFTESTIHRSTQLLKISIVLVSCGACAGCLNTDFANRDGLVTAAGRSSSEGVSKLSEEYRANPDDTHVALAYSEALERSGNTDQSLAIARKILIKQPQNKLVLARYGKALAAAGQYSMAIDAMERAQTPDQPDWRLLSAEATVLDRVGDFDRARSLYERAQTLAPKEPSIISNMGVSLMLSGDLPGAEANFRRAIAMNEVDPRTRENLALVVGLQKRYEEARKLYSDILPAQQVEENMEYISQIAKA